MGQVPSEGQDQKGGHLAGGAVTEGGRDQVEEGRPGAG